MAKQIIEGFEDGDLNSWNGDTGEFFTQQSTVFEGSFAVTNSSTGGFIHRSDIAPGIGETPFGAAVYNKSADAVAFYWGVPEQTGGVRTGYNLEISSRKFGTSIALNRRGDNRSELGSTSVSLTDNKWYVVTVTQWDSSGNMSVDLVDPADDTVVGTVTATDSTYTNAGIGLDGFGDKPADSLFKPAPPAPTAPSNLTLTQS